MGKNEVSVASLVRSNVARLLPQYDHGDASIDESALCEDSLLWVAHEYPQVCAAEERSWLRKTVMAAIKTYIQSRRPTARQIEEQCTSGQMTLPSFEEACHEVYRDGEGKAVRLIDMLMKSLYEAGMQYLRLGDENTTKGKRLLATYSEMRRRGFRDQDSVRQLYCPAVNE